MADYYFWSHFLINGKQDLYTEDYKEYLKNNYETRGKLSDYFSNIENIWKMEIYIKLLLWEMYFMESLNPLSQLAPL